VQGCGGGSCRECWPGLVAGAGTDNNGWQGKGSALEGPLGAGIAQQGAKHGTMMTHLETLF
jgi:hypothetical protein